MHRPISLSLALALLAATAGAQKVSRVVPEVVSPGDLVILEGTGLGATTSVDFSGQVGGFAGFLLIKVAPLSVTPTLVAAICPQFNAFAPPNAVPPGGPFGAVSVSPSDQDGVTIYLTEGSAGAVATAGIGSSLAGGARAVISFDLKGGEPVSPNPGFVLRLQLAAANAPAILAIGAPATPPLVPFGDGTIALDVAGPLFFTGGFTTDAAGELAAPLAIPPGLTAKAALQWVFLDPATLGLAISNGLVVDF